MASRTVMLAPVKIGMSEASSGASRAIPTIATSASGTMVKEPGSALKVFIKKTLSPHPPAAAKGMAINKAKKP